MVASSWDLEMVVLVDLGALVHHGPLLGHGLHLAHDFHCWNSVFTKGTKIRGLLCDHMVPLEPEVSMSFVISLDIDTSGSKGTNITIAWYFDDIVQLQI